MIKVNAKNYKGVTKDVDFSKLSKSVQDAHKEFDDFLEFYNDDSEIKKMLDNHFKALEKELNKKAKAKTSVKAKPTSRKISKRTVAVSTKSKPKQAVHKSNEVSVIPIEIRIMKRYLGLDGKKVTERQVTLFYRMIQRAATEGTIRKTSKYALFIKAIGKDLAETYKEMENTAKFEIPAPLKIKVQTVVDSYGVKPAIALVKRFINLYGGVTPEKAERLLKSIRNAEKNGKVSKSDSTYEKIQEIESHLENYLQSDKLIITDIQLNGLRGIAGIKK